MVAVTLDHDVKVFQNLLAGFETTVFVHDDHTELVTSVEDFLGGEIVSATICVCAHFLQAFNTVILNGIGDGNADAGVILMVAGAHDLDGAVIQEKALFCIDAECAEANSRFFVIHDHTVLDDFNTKGIKLGIIHVPTDGAGNGKLLEDRFLRTEIAGNILLHMLAHKDITVIDRCMNRGFDIFIIASISDGVQSARSCAYSF
jgi:hypothetical protein